MKALHHPEVLFNTSCTPNEFRLTSFPKEHTAVSCEKKEKETDSSIFNSTGL